MHSFPSVHVLFSCFIFVPWNVKHAADCTPAAFLRLNMSAGWWTVTYFRWLCILILHVVTLTFSFFPFFFSRNLHFIHFWLLPLQTLSAALFYTYFLSFFHHDPFISFPSVVKAAVFSGAFSHEEADSCFFLLKCSEISLYRGGFQTFSFSFSITPFHCFYLSFLFQFLSTSVFLCFPLPIWRIRLCDILL